MSYWTKSEDGWVTEASELKLGVGEAPGHKLVPTKDGLNYVQIYCFDWKEERCDGELISWYAICKGVKYTVFND